MVCDDLTLLENGLLLGQEYYSSDLANSISPLFVLRENWEIAQLKILYSVVFSKPSVFESVQNNCRGKMRDIVEISNFYETRTFIIVFQRLETIEKFDEGKCAQNASRGDIFSPMISAKAQRSIALHLPHFLSSKHLFPVSCVLRFSHVGWKKKGNRY
jgi:hypothetical protein